MEIPFVGPTLQQAVDAVGGGAALVGGTVGLFQATATSVTGAAIGATSAPALYNPPGNNKLFRIMRVLYGDVSGTIARFNMRYYWQANPVLSGLTEGSGAQAIQSRSRGVAPTAKFYTALTVGAAATQFMPVGFGSGGAIAAQFYWLQDQPEGITTVLPGEIWWPYVSNGALAMVADVGLIWIETPIPTGN
jgi:hypothetical protein